MAQGQHYWYSFLQSLRDADDDGTENQLDTCPTIANPEWDPRSGAGDSDGDMFADLFGCDPNGTTFDLNVDLDIAANGLPWINSGDNCPKVANPDNLDGEINQPYSVAAPKGGPKGDGIGDGDTTVDAADADEPTANGPFRTALLLQAVCIGEADDDGDGFCNASETSLGSCSADPCGGAYPNLADLNGDAVVNAADSTPEHPSLIKNMILANAGSGGTIGAEGEIGEPLQVCNDGIDNDGDGLTDSDDSTYTNAGGTITYTGCLLNATDGDGYNWQAENHVFHGEWQYNCKDAIDQDSDGGDGAGPLGTNDGCPAVLTAETAGAQCDNAVDDDGDGFVNDGCAVIGDLEQGAQCRTVADEDGDTVVNDGCPQVGPSESGADCANNTDDDADTIVNDGCPCGSWPLNTFRTAPHTNRIDVATLLDMIAPVNKVGTNPGMAGFDMRYDLVPGNQGLGFQILMGDFLELITKAPPFFGAVNRDVPTANDIVAIRTLTECPYP